VQNTAAVAVVPTAIIAARIHHQIRSGRLALYRR
jgi:hypothetical protein